jgi:hypothetical protein
VQEIPLNEDEALVDEIVEGFCDTSSAKKKDGM